MRGRFLGEDPLGVGDGESSLLAYIHGVGNPRTNLYQYTDDNPLSYVDPLGLGPWERVGNWLVRIEIPIAGKLHAHVQGAVRSNRKINTQFDSKGILREGATIPIPKDKTLRNFLRIKGFRLGVLAQVLDMVATLKDISNAPAGSIMAVYPLGGVEIIRPEDPRFPELFRRKFGGT